MKHKKASMLATGALVAGLTLGGIGYAYGEPIEGATTEANAFGHLGNAVHRAGGGLAGIVADLTGLDGKDVMERRADGESFAAIAEAEGVDPANVKAEALERADEIIDERLTSTDELRRRGMRGGPGANPVTVLADMTGLEAEAIHDLRADGNSFASIAADNGVDIDEVIDTMISDAEEKLRDRVDDGRLTDEKVADILDEMRERLTEMMDSTEAPPEGGPRSGGPGGMGGGPRG